MGPWAGVRVVPFPLTSRTCRQARLVQSPRLRCQPRYGVHVLHVSFWRCREREGRHGVEFPQVGQKTICLQLFGFGLREAVQPYPSRRLGLLFGLPFCPPVFGSSFRPSLSLSVSLHSHEKKADPPFSFQANSLACLFVDTTSATDVEVGGGTLGKGCHVSSSNRRVRSEFSGRLALHMLYDTVGDAAS